MKKLLLVVLAAAAIIGCEKNEDGTQSVSALIEGNGEGWKTAWKAGDSWTLFSGEETYEATYLAEDMFAMSSGNSNAGGSLGDIVDGMYGFYPSSAILSSTATTVTFALPGVQDGAQAGASGIAPSENYPLSGKVADGRMQFRNICSLLEISVRAADALDGKTLDEIVVSSDVPISGTATLTLGTVSCEVSGSDTLVLEMGGVTLSSSEFVKAYAAVPAGEYGSVKVALMTGGVKMAEYELVKEETTLARSKVYGLKIDEQGSLAAELDEQIAAGCSYKIASVYDVDYAPGQFTNTMPKGMDTKENAIAATAEKLVGNGSMVHLGGWGGSVTVGFDHSILNLAGSDMRVLGNGFAGSSEPAVIYVAQKDADGNPGEWYILKHSMYEYAIHDYEITYYKPENDPAGALAEYIYWTDNKGHFGYEAKNAFHRQSYWPEYAGETIVIKGEYLPTNSFDTSGKGTSYVQDAKWWGFPLNEKNFGMGAYGFCDNYPNADDLSTVDIEWAVDSKGNAVHLDRIDFVRVQTATHRQAGWLGENSTEFAGVEDLHIKGESITVDTSVVPDPDNIPASGDAHQPATGYCYWPYDAI